MLETFTAALDTLRFELPIVLLSGLPLVLTGLILTAVLLGRRGVTWPRRVLLLALRGGALALLVVLLARPVAVVREDPSVRRTVGVLLDESASMALRENGTTRYELARSFAEEHLLPRLEARGFTADVHLFAGGARPAGIRERRETTPDGERTDLGGALVEALRGQESPPVAMIALSDGIANRSAQNRAALAALEEAGAPFIGLAVGDVSGVTSLSVETLSGPDRVAPGRAFALTAELQANGGGEVPGFDLLLLEGEELLDVRRVPPGPGARRFTERFELVEEGPGLHEYTVLLETRGEEIVTVSRRASTGVEVSDEEAFRILFAQGALTWNFKFLGRALRKDPGITLTGFSRTSERSVFRQNLESAEELAEGFPDELAELVPYRVLVLSDLAPGDLSPKEQEAVARFVGELGGGLLLIGGSGTFNVAWRGSRLEDLLPITFDDDPAIVGLDRPFHLRLTPAARAHPVFAVDEGRSSRELWDRLPTFLHYGRVRAAKPGATIWARHSEDLSPAGERRILLASQPYGAGLSAVVTLQNLWRWRLAKDSDPAHFDRFWQQFLRYLGQAAGRQLEVRVTGDERVPGSELGVLVERRPRPDGGANENGESGSGGELQVRIEAPGGEIVGERRGVIGIRRPAELRFRAEEEGSYTVRVLDPAGTQILARPIEIRRVDREMERTGRDLENLRQWASLTGGVARMLDASLDVDEVVDEIEIRVDAARRTRERRRPLGVNGEILAILLLFLGGEWTLRKLWGLS